MRDEHLLHAYVHGVVGRPPTHNTLDGAHHVDGSSSSSSSSSSNFVVGVFDKRYLAFAILGAGIIFAMCYAVYYYQFMCCARRRGRREAHSRSRRWSSSEPSDDVPDQLTFAHLYGRFLDGEQNHDPYYDGLDGVDRPLDGHRRLIVRLRNNEMAVVMAGLPLRGQLPGRPTPPPSPMTNETPHDDVRGVVRLQHPAAQEGVDLHNGLQIVRERQNPHNPFGTDESNSSFDVERHHREVADEEAVGFPYGVGYYTDIHGMTVEPTEDGSVAEEHVFVEE